MKENGHGKSKLILHCPAPPRMNLTGRMPESLISNGVMLVAEVSNMGCTPDAVEEFHRNKILFAPGKAVNAGGVATSGLEMTQNSMKLRWNSQEVDNRLHEIMMQYS